jgi:hypothetical protein
MKNPLSATMACALFDQIQPGQTYQEASDLFFGTFALSFRIEEIKRIDASIKELPKSSPDYVDLMEKRQEIKATEDAEVLRSRRHLLEAFGKSIFEQNGNSITGFQDLNERTLKTSMSSLSKADKDLALRLALHERFDKVKENTLGRISLIRFFHRSMRELMVAHGLVLNQSKLPRRQGDTNFDDRDLSTLLCTFITHLKLDLPSFEFKASLLWFIEYIFASYQALNDWRLLQIFSYFSWLYCKTANNEHQQVMSEVFFNGNDDVPSLLHLLSQHASAQMKANFQSLKKKFSKACSHISQRIGVVSVKHQLR